MMVKFFDWLIIELFINVDLLVIDIICCVIDKKNYWDWWFFVIDYCMVRLV